MSNITSDNITSLGPNEIFCYGANRAGIHGKGAAKQALQWGAIYGKVGFVGQTYGICTKDENIQTLGLKDIYEEIQAFLLFAWTHPQFHFLVTAIGTGLADLKVEEIAPMFDNVPPNVSLPLSFWEIIG